MTTQSNRIFGILILSVLALYLAACGTKIQTPAPSQTQPLPEDDHTPTDTAQTLSLSCEPTADPSAALGPRSPHYPPDLSHYHLDLQLNQSDPTFRGSLCLEYVNNEIVPLEQLYFRLYPNGGNTYGDGHLTVENVLVESIPVDTELSVDNSVLKLNLPESLSPGEPVQISMDFYGEAPLDFGDPPSGYGSYNFSQDVLALSGWYPILAVYDESGWHLDAVPITGDAVTSDIALYSVEISAPTEMVVAATGVVTESQQVDDRIHRTYASGPARDFMIVASPGYQTATWTEDGIMVNAYYLPDDKTAGEQAVQVGRAAIKAFRELFGAYPYNEFDIVQAPMRGAGGVEYPGVVLIESEAYKDPSSIDFIAVIAHETSHQWFYNAVGNDVIDEPWLDEALATYAMALYYEQTQGRPAYDSAIEHFQQGYETYLEMGTDGPVTGSQPYFESHADMAYAPVIYIKGALFLAAVRAEIGDEAFFSALQSYYADQVYQIATGDDLLSSFEQAAGRELDDFYAPWLYMPTAEAPTVTPTPTPIPSPTPTPAPVVIAVIGDYGANSPEEADVAALVHGWKPDLIITTGDNNYPYGSADTIDAAIGQYYHDFIHPYTGMYGAGAQFNRFFPTLGNHDILTDDGQPYYDYFILPGNERYYTFSWGSVAFFALNDVDDPDGLGLSSAQAEWLRQGLAASSAVWKLVYMHYPPYSSGYHGSTDWARWPYAEWGATAVFAGHDHTYERLSIDGTLYFVNGLGGGAIYDFVQVVDGSQIRYNADYGAILIQATPERIFFQFINRHGEVIDTYEIIAP